MNDNLARLLVVEEYRALRSEMLLRIAIQNVTIVTTIAVFVACVALTITNSEKTALIALFQSVATLALALQWCHQGVRQCALKNALLAHEERAGLHTSWENWLPSQRPSTFLGSRWFVSTKAVFLGLNLALTAYSLSNFALPAIGAVIVFLITFVALLTNPKE